MRKGLNFVKKVTEGNRNMRIQNLTLSLEQTGNFNKNKIQNKKSIE